MRPPTAVTLSSSPSLSVSYRMTAAEAYRASRMVLPRWITAAIGVGIGLFILAGIVLLVTGSTTLGVSFVSVGIAVFALRPLVRWRLMHRISKGLAKVPDDVVVVIEADGIHAARGDSSAVLAWSDVSSIDVRGDFVWVQGRLRPAYIIPTRAFGDAADVDRFVTAARGYLAATIGRP
jgi:hypothetical protein